MNFKALFYFFNLIFIFFSLLGSWIRAADPDMNGSFSINRGLRVARQLLLDINNLGVPAGVEYLDVVSPQYISDLVCKKREKKGRKREAGDVCPSANLGLLVQVAWGAIGGMFSVLCKEEGGGG